MKAQFLNRDGFSIRFVTEGAGPPIVIVGSSIYYARTFSKSLRERFTLVFIDHRGFSEKGQTELSPAALLAAVIEDIDAVIDALSLSSFAILGHSGHAYMALTYAANFPDKVSNVIVVAAGPNQSERLAIETEALWNRIYEPMRKSAFEEDFAELSASLKAATDRRFVNYCLAMRARSWHDFTFDAASLWRDVKVNMPVIEKLWGIAFREFDTIHVINCIKAKVLIVLGLHDYLVAPHWTWDQFIQERGNVTIHLLGNSGHTPQLEQPDDFAEILIKFMMCPSLR